MHVIEWAQIATGVVNLTTLTAQTTDLLPAFERRDYGAAAERLRQSNFIRLMQKGPFPKDFEPEQFEAYLRCIRAIKETGFPTWYEWSLKHWGTKWNAYEATRVNPGMLKFQTAWSAPLVWLGALAKQFPTCAIRLRWADEDFGSNVGDITFHETTVTGGHLPNGSRDAQELALELLHDGVLPDYMERQVDGSIGYRAEDED